MEEIIAVITQFITSVGFPIAVTCYLLYSQNRRDQAHKEEMDSMTKALNDNTVVIQKLVDRMDVIYDVSKSDN